MLFARTGRVGDDFLVGDRDHALVGNRGDVEGRFVIRFVERGKGAAGVGGFKLRGRVLAPLIVFAQVKSAHLVVENARVCDVDRSRCPRRSGFSTDSTTISFVFFGRDFRLLRWPPLVIVTSWKSMSTAFSVISEVGFKTRIVIVSSPSNFAFSRSGVKVRL